MTAMSCLPESRMGTAFYHPTDQGEEAKFKQRYEEILQWKKEHRE